VSPRQESSEGPGATAAAGVSRGAAAVAAERSSAAPGNGGVGRRYRDEREANGSARDMMRAMAGLALALVSAIVCGGGSEGEVGMEPGASGWGVLLGFFWFPPFRALIRGETDLCSPFSYGVQGIAVLLCACCALLLRALWSLKCLSIACRSHVFHISTSGLFGERFQYLDLNSHAFHSGVGCLACSWVFDSFGYSAEQSPLGSAWEIASAKSNANSIRTTRRR
jgi:hypothetical protein